MQKEAIKKRSELTILLGKYDRTPASDIACPSGLVGFSLLFLALALVDFFGGIFGGASAARLRRHGVG